MAAVTVERWRWVFARPCGLGWSGGWESKKWSHLFLLTNHQYQNSNILHKCSTRTIIVLPLFKYWQSASTSTPTYFSQPPNHHHLSHISHPNYFCSHKQSLFLYTLHFKCQSIVKKYSKVLWLFILKRIMVSMNSGIYMQYDQYMKALESLSEIKIYVISYMMYHLQKHSEQSIHTLPYMVYMVCDISCIQRLIYDIVSCLYTFPNPKINASLSPPVSSLSNIVQS